MADFVGHPFVQALAWTLVHFLWQGAAIGLVALVLMRSSRLPWTRYAIGVGALALMLIAPIVTLLVQLSLSIVADAEITLASALGSTAAVTLSNVATDGGGALTFRLPDIMFAAIVGLWLAGVGVFGLRLAGGMDGRPPSGPSGGASSGRRDSAAGGGGEGAARRAPGGDRYSESSLVAVPVMVGWLKPVIVLPAAALAGADTRSTRITDRARTGARAATRLSRQPPPVNRRGAVVLPPRGLVGLASRPHGA